MVPRLAGKIDDRGRILLPAKLRRELGIEPGMDVLLTCSDGMVRLETRAQALARARRLASRIARPGTPVVDEFLAERREEARRDAQRQKSANRAAGRLRRTGTRRPDGRG